METPGCKTDMLLPIHLDCVDYKTHNNSDPTSTKNKPCIHKALPVSNATIKQARFKAQPKKSAPFQRALTICVRSVVEDMSPSSVTRQFFFSGAKHNSCQ